MRFETMPAPTQRPSPSASSVEPAPASERRSVNASAPAKNAVTNMSFIAADSMRTKSGDASKARTDSRAVTGSTRRRAILRATSRVTVPISTVAMRSPSSPVSNARITDA